MTRIIFLLIAVLLVISGCGQAEEESNGRLNVYTTVFPFKSFVEQIGGDHVQVQSIYPNGTDIHTYEPTQKDTLKIAEGDLFVYSSGELDPVAGKIASVVKDEQKLLAVAEDINDSQLLDHHNDSGEVHDHDHEHDHESSLDPHVWLDPVLNESFAEQIKDELIAKDPEHKKDYNENYRQLVKDIKAIDQQLRDITAQPKRDTVYISHESLGYLADRYHFKEVGVSGMNNNEPSQSEIVGMINDINDSNTPYIIYEQNVSSKITDIIAEDTNVESLKFHNMAVLTDEDKSATYQSMMKQNIETLDKALNDKED